jgi:hypothetical protein
VRGNRGESARGFFFVRVLLVSAASPGRDQRGRDEPFVRGSLLQRVPLAADRAVGGVHAERLGGGDGDERDERVALVVGIRASPLRTVFGRARFFLAFGRLVRRAPREPEPRRPSRQTLVRAPKRGAGISAAARRAARVQRRDGERRRGGFWAARFAEDVAGGDAEKRDGAARAGDGHHLRAREGDGRRSRRSAVFRVLAAGALGSATRLVFVARRRPDDGRAKRRRGDAFAFIPFPVSERRAREPQHALAQVRHRAHAGGVAHEQQALRRIDVRLHTRHRGGVRAELAHQDVPGERLLRRRRIRASAVVPRIRASQVQTPVQHAHRPARVQVFERDVHLHGAALAPDDQHRAAAREVAKSHRAVLRGHAGVGAGRRERGGDEPTDALHADAHRRALGARGGDYVPLSGDASLEPPAGVVHRAAGQRPGVPPRVPPRSERLRPGGVERAREPPNDAGARRRRRRGAPHRQPGHDLDDLLGGQRLARRGRLGFSFGFS